MIDRSDAPHEPPVWLTSTLLLTVQLLPPLPLYLGAATSMALGTTMAGAAVLFACWLQAALGDRKPLSATLDFVVIPMMITIVIMALVLAHSIVADAIQTGDMARSVASYGPLSFLFAGGIVFGVVMSRSSDRTVNLAVRTSGYVLMGVLALKVFGLQPRGDFFAKSMFPFQETSHFALAVTPMLMYACVRARGRRSLRLLLAGIVLGLLLQSVVLLVGCILIAAACRRLLTIVALAVPVGLIGLPLGLEYYRSRLDFSGAVVNLSNLVYVQGWQMIQESMNRSHGWGIGFQQMGFRFTEVDAAQIIRVIMGGVDANVTDGSFVFSKVASEFGLFGILLTVMYVVAAGRCILALRQRRSRCAITLAHCIVVAYAIDVFVRGPGYFVESTLLFVAASATLLTSPGPSPIARAIKGRLRRPPGSRQPHAVDQSV